MTTNQTIDGVPRDDLELVLLHGHSTHESDQAWDRLRALLDAPSTKVKDRCGVVMVDCPECSHQWDYFFECRNKPAAQPQGEPVAWSYKERVYASGIGHVWREKIEREAPDAESFYIKDLTPLYTEQPAPVAVASLEVVGRLNTK